MRIKIALILGIIFLLGAGYIIYNGRPIMKLKNTDQLAMNTDTATTPDESNQNGQQQQVLGGQTQAVDPSNYPDDKDEEKNEIENEEEDDDDSKTPIQTSPSPVTPPTTSSNPQPKPATTQKNGYTMADVQAHATQSSCWSAINGSVYDLSTWISRHPGGSKPIIGLCGTDGSGTFTSVHGGSSKAQTALVLLKIGSFQ